MRGSGDTGSLVIWVYIGDFEISCGIIISGFYKLMCETPDEKVFIELSLFGKW